MRRCSTTVAMILVLLVAAHPVLAATLSQAVGIELLGGTLGGVGGAAIGIAAIGSIAPSFDSRATRIGAVISSVTLGGGLGATLGFNWSGADPG